MEPGGDGDTSSIYGLFAVADRAAGVWRTDAVALSPEPEPARTPLSDARAAPSRSAEPAGHDEPTANALKVFAAS
ncbi:hypothetical protein KGM_212100 [Danaus plexippus plexippus]|uniref:Uncharacterized protein n=1 Tax=Danaus plexippus plexippus TaxID=278856 RepID=A0A212EK34_DANPL|nr:hypothetical protein KGM_212100 [Danaus plexippus plexippus]